MAAKIRVTAIQRLCVNDGPGVRTVVFLKGCYLECPWCCNPEAIHYDKDYYLNKGRCHFPSQTSFCRQCELHGGGIQKDCCPLGAFEKTCQDYESEELFVLLMRDENLYRNGGGVTFSGGEPLLQAIALEPLLKKLKDNGIHIAFESSLYAPTEKYDTVKTFVDCWIVDLKFQYGYFLNRDIEMDKDSLDRNLLDLQKRKNNIIYRMVIMSEILWKLDTIVENLKNHHVETLELLPCHSLAENKYKELNKSFRRFKAPSKVDLDKACAIMKANSIDAHYVLL